MALEVGKIERQLYSCFNLYNSSTFNPNQHILEPSTKIANRRFTFLYTNRVCFPLYWSCHMQTLHAYYQPNVQKASPHVCMLWREFQRLFPAQSQPAWWLPLHLWEDSGALGHDEGYDASDKIQSLAESDTCSSVERNKTPVDQSCLQTIQKLKFKEEKCYLIGVWCV